MKKRIGNLRGKPIIEGDKNLMTANELHIDSLGKSDNEGGGSVRTWYYKWSDQASQELKLEMIAMGALLYPNMTLLSNGGAFNFHGRSATDDELMACTALKIEDLPTYYYDTYYEKNVYIYNGSLWDRIVQFQTKNKNEIDPSAVEAAKQELGVFLVEITKEEWEAMITDTIYEFKPVE